jgi:tol-pal system protein YbgF
MMASMPRKTVVSVLALALLSAGCLTNTQTNSLQADVEDLRSQFQLLQNEHAAIREQITGQADEIRAILEAAAGPEEDRTAQDRAELFTRLDSMQREMGILLEKLDDTNFRLSALSGDIQATRNMFSYGQLPEPVAGSEGAAEKPTPGAPLQPSLEHPSVSVAPGSASPQEIYNTAYADYTKGNYPLAILGFQEYLDKFGSSDFADDALYWVGESYFSQGKFSDAIGAFEEVLRLYPQGDKVPAAHLKKGLSYLESNQTAQAVVQLSALVENYPNSDEARLARERLKNMGLRDR